MTQSTPINTYTQGHSTHTITTQALRTASDAASFLLPYITPASHILDVGCGPGSITTSLAAYTPSGSITGIDISLSVLEKARALAAAANIPTSGPGSVIFEEGDILSTLKYPDETFDIVYSSQFFGHLIPPHQPLLALAEIRRVLKPGGVLATRDSIAQHFYPPSCDMDRLWVGNMKRVISHGLVDHTAAILPQLVRQAGFDEEGQVIVGAGTNVFQGAEMRGMLKKRAEGQLSEGDEFRKSWVEAGITEGEIRETLEAVRNWAGTEGAFYAALQLELLAWK